MKLKPPLDSVKKMKEGYASSGNHFTEEKADNSKKTFTNPGSIFVQSMMSFVKSFRKRVWPMKEWLTAACVKHCHRISGPIQMYFSLDYMPCQSQKNFW